LEKKIDLLEERCAMQASEIQRLVRILFDTEKVLSQANAQKMNIRQMEFDI